MSSRNSAATRLPAVDLIKVVAAQLIVFHHFAWYGPLRDIEWTAFDGVVPWLGEYGRVAVQMFLVVGGYLAARGMAGDAMLASRGPTGLGRRLWSRYLRLVGPLAATMVVASVVAAIVRPVLPGEMVPEPATALGVLTHLLLVHDLAGVPALSVGFWYLAVDFQLYLLLALLVWLAGRLARRGQSYDAKAWAVVLVVCLACLSLFLFNRDDSLDIWGVYFFGSYGLGALAGWASRTPRARWALYGMLVLTALALLIDWRTRIALAALTALALSSGPAMLAARLPTSIQPMLSRLSDSSFALFLMHFPVFLLVEAAAFRWPLLGEQPDGVTMALAWVLSMGAAWLFHRQVELRLMGSLPRRPVSVRPAGSP